MVFHGLNFLRDHVLLHRNGVIETLQESRVHLTFFQSALVLIPDALKHVLLEVRVEFLHRLYFFLKLHHLFVDLGHFFGDDDRNICKVQSRKWINFDLSS